MIVYADTSALVKLFVVEEGSQAMRDFVLDAWVIGTGLLTRAELGAALARGARRGLISETEALKAHEGLKIIWPTWVHISIDEDLVSRAEDIAWEYRLRGYDAIHLASALAWQDRIEQQVVLATFDQELGEAARRASLLAWPG